ENKHKTAFDRYRKEAKNIMTEMERAKRKGDSARAKDLHMKYKSVIMELVAYSRKNKIPLDLPAFNRSVRTATRQRLDAKVRPQDVRKAARKELGQLQEVLGTK